MKHRVPFWAIMLALVFLALALILIGVATPALAQEGDGQAARYGAAIYAEFCQACHGPRGEAIAEGLAFQAIEFDAATARDVIAQGRDSSPDDNAAMPGYAQKAGGPLSETRLDQVLAYMATWDTGDVPPLPAPNLHPKTEQVPDYFGDAQRGAELYALSCYGCHGAEGRGRVPPNFPGFTYNRGTFRQVASAGAGGSAMPGFGVESGGPLSEHDLEDLETYVASWSIKPPKAAPSPEGWSTLLVILGVIAVLAVGGYYGGGFSLAETSDSGSAADDAGKQS